LNDIISAIEGARLDHVAVGVHSIDHALLFYRDVLGGVPQKAGHNKRMKFRAVTVRLPNGGRIELLEPSGPDSFMVRFLEGRGEGFHHITVIVPDIHQAIATLEARGITPVQVNLERPDWQEIFVHPRDAHGALIQIVQSNRPELNRAYE
jgi:methylmalonyl-CoA/ethylmalonyl-CoA epimerase